MTPLYRASGMPPLERHARWSGMLEKHYTLDGRGYLRLVNPQPCCDSPHSQHSRNHCPFSRFLCRAFFPSVYVVGVKSRAGHEKGLSNGTASNRDFLSDRNILSEISSAWLQEYWTGPPVRIYPLRAVPQASPHYNRRDVIIDLPAFLPARNMAAHRRG
jgi:hypothetical protein